jgi:Tol biopolymer transport system component
MSQTSLQVLDIDLKQFFVVENSQKEVLTKINDNSRSWLFYTNIEKKQYILPREKRVSKCFISTLKFRNIVQLKASYLIQYKGSIELS